MGAGLWASSLESSLGCAGGSAVVQGSCRGWVCASGWEGVRCVGWVYTAREGHGFPAGHCHAACFFPDKEIYSLGGA